MILLLRPIFLIQNQKLIKLMSVGWGEEQMDVSKFFVAAFERYLNELMSVFHHLP